MKRHHNPTPSEIVQRYRFNSRFRKGGESVVQYIAELRALAEFCNYDTSLDDILHDRLFCGIEDPPVQRRLLAEERLTFKKAADIALAMETAAKNAETLQRSTTYMGDARKAFLHKVQTGEKHLKNSPLRAVIVVDAQLTRLPSVLTRKPSVMPVVRLDIEEGMPQSC